ncbi:uncharacterized protein LOC144425868, partial [Styela clava]
MEYNGAFEGSKSEILEKLSSGSECPLCHPKTAIVHLGKHLEVMHLNNAISFSNVFILPCRRKCFALFRKSESEKKRSHFHCPYCPKMYGRSAYLKSHLSSQRGKCCSSKLECNQKSGLKSDGFKKRRLQENTLFSVIPEQYGYAKTKKEIEYDASAMYQCRICGKCFVNLISLRNHGQIEHKIIQVKHPCICVDSANGIYMVAQSAGLLAPIHVQKHLKLGVSRCSNSNCLHAMENSQNPGFECVHLEAVNNAQMVTSTGNTLQISALSYLRRINMIGAEREELCLNLLNACNDKCCPLAVRLDFASLGYKDRQIYFSVFEETAQYYSKLGRVRVTFDQDICRWSCACPISNETRTCIHEILCKWNLASNDADLFKKTSIPSTRTISEMDVLSMKYLMSKKIPFDHSSRMITHLSELSPPDIFCPPENHCPHCQGDLMIFERKKATVYSLGQKWNGITIMNKKCVSCGLIVRFQEYQSGFHNFNNRTILSLKLCVYLMKGVENHISVGTSLRTLFDDSVEETTIRNGFYHFCALLDIDYDFVCYKCGSNPKVLIGDGNWKNTCVREAKTLQSSIPQGDEVDCQRSWSNYQMEILGRGIYGMICICFFYTHDIIAISLYSGSQCNPWKNEIGYDTIVPWIGEKSRGVVLNTEYKKGVLVEAPDKKKESDGTVTHEEIMNIL